MRTIGDIIDLDPARIRTTEDQAVGFAIYSRLVKYRAGGFQSVEPDLAERWSVSPDGRQYTFWLRRDAKWHRGYGEVTSADVKFSLDRLSDRKIGSLYLSQAAIIDQVRAVGSHQVEVHLKNPYPGFLTEFLAYRPGFIVSEKAVQELGDKYTANAVGSGPFFLDRWQTGSRVVLKANPDFYGKRARVEQVTLIIIKEDPLFEISLEKGDIDIGYIVDPDVQQRVIRSKNIRTIIKPAPQTQFVSINTSVRPWNDVRVRRALWHATDRQGIINGVYHGLARISDTLLNPYVFAYDGKIVYKYDPERARRLLEEAGYSGTLDAELAYYPLDLWPKQAPAVQASWRTAGINVALRLYEPAQIFERLRQGAFAVSGFAIMRVGPDQIFSILLHSRSIPLPNAARYSNPEMDALIDAARVEVNDKRRAELYGKIQDKVREDVPVIPLYQQHFVLASKTTVKGAVFPGLQAFNFEDIYKEGR